MHSPRALSQTLALLALIAAPAWTGAQAASVPGPAIASSTVQLDELEVVGKRLYQIRMHAVVLEDRIYALYNDLNKDDEFDVHCSVESPIGTHLTARRCRLALYETAREEEVRGFFTGDSVPPAELVALARYADYQKHALAVINSNPQLRRLVRERQSLEKKYRVAYQERFGSN